MNIEFMEKDKIVMKLIRYFIIEKSYSPVVVHGVKDEIWLENLNSEYKVVRIVSNYLHNNEQLEFDLFKTDKIASSIKFKTLTFDLNLLNIYVDLSSKIEDSSFGDINHVILNKDDSNQSNLKKIFPNIEEFLKDNGESEEELFLKITSEINDHRIIENKKTEEVFAFKTPFITIGLLILHTVLYLMMYFKIDIINTILENNIINKIISNYNYDSIVLFIILNVLFYIAASRIEKFYGIFKFLLIYISSIAICTMGGMLFSIDNYILLNGIIGAQLGALFYFGTKYRLYIVSLFKTILIYYLIILVTVNILDIKEFILSLILGIMSGVFTSMLLGFKYHKNKFAKINGLVLFSILTIFLVYMNFFN